MGEVSYSVYLIHSPVGIVIFDVVMGPNPTTSVTEVMGWLLGVTAIITLLSWLSHRFFELPTCRMVIAAGKRVQPELAPPPEK